MSYNYLPPNAFDFRIQGLPETAFKTTNVIIPSIALPSATLPWREATQYFSGGALDYEPLQIEFIVDEDLLNYTELYTWLHQNQKGDTGMSYRDALVPTLTSASNFNRIFTFKNAFPETIGSLNFRTDVGADITYITCTATFRYSEITLDGTTLTS